MKKIVIVVVSFFLLINKTQAQSEHLEDVIAEVNPTVVSVIADREDEQSLGAGIIISDDGYAVTNAHVTEDADKITVVTIEDESYEAELIGTDAQTDISLLKINRNEPFVSAKFADSEEVRVGNPVFAIGNPFGLGNSVSLGIISAKERDIEKGPYDNFLQTDTAINQGNSGGPLFNDKGEIVGLNTAIFSTDGMDMGVGFATPSNVVAWVVSELKENGKVIRGWLGMSIQKSRSSEAEHKNKLLIASMAEDSPAAKAGLKVGDIIERAGDIPLKNPRYFSYRISQKKPGEKIEIEVLRDGNSEPITVEVGEKKLSETEKTKKQKGSSFIQASDFPELGFSAYFDEKTQEFVVVEVQKDSEAEAKGIFAGDRFKGVNGYRVFGEEDLKIRIKQAADKGEITLQFIGTETLDTIVLKLEKVDEQN